MCETIMSSLSLWTIFVCLAAVANAQPPARDYLPPQTAPRFPGSNNLGGGLPPGSGSEFPGGAPGGGFPGGAPGGGYPGGAPGGGFPGGAPGGGFPGGAPGGGYPGGAPGGGFPGGAPGGGLPGGESGGEAEGGPVSYEFSYEVKDVASGNDFGHSESRNGDVAKGKYYVVLPDGRKQIVEYTADENGYKPEVKYEGEAKPGPQGPSGDRPSGGYPNEPQGPSGGYPSGGPGGFPSPNPAQSGGYPSGGPGGFTTPSGGGYRY